LNISSSQSPFIYVDSIHDKVTTTINSLKPYMDSLLRSSVETVELTPNHTLKLPAGDGITLGIQVPNLIDLQQVVKKIQKQMGEKKKEIDRLESRLSSTNFIEKAEPSVIEESKVRLTKLNDDWDVLYLAEQQLATMLN